MNKQDIRDRVRNINKLVIPFAGKKSGLFSLLSRKGRKTGQVNRTPLIAEPVDGGFVIALTYSKKVDWCANVLANGGCDLRWQEKDYMLTAPVFIDQETGLKAFPAFISRMLRRAELEHFLHLTIKKNN